MLVSKQARREARMKEKRGKRAYKTLGHQGISKQTAPAGAQTAAARAQTNASARSNSKKREATGRRKE